MTTAPGVLRSAWAKWARGVEHQQVLARTSREWAQAGERNRYQRCDNAADRDDEVVRMHWHLAEAAPIPERWGVLLGDVLTNLRAALDHAMWAAVYQHSGPPARPQVVQFPIVGEAARMTGYRKDLQPLVSPGVWDLVEAVQPHHLDDPQRHPLETLRWASNIDKHRFPHVVARAFQTIGPILVRSAGRTLRVLSEEWNPGHVEVGDVVAAATLRRPADARELDIAITFAHQFELQVGELPPAWVPLAEVMDAVTDQVLAILGTLAGILGDELPDVDSLETGAEHAAFAPEFGGQTIRWNP